MQCTNCGATMTERDVLCPKCGSVAYLETIPTNNTVTSETTVTNTKKKSPVPVILTVALVMIVGIFVAIFALTGENNPGTQKPVAGETTTEASIEQDEPYEDEAGDDEDEWYTHGTTEALYGAELYLSKFEKTNSGIVAPEDIFDIETYYIRPDEGLNIRTGPGEGYDSLDVIRQGKKVEAFGDNGGSSWCFVYYPDEDLYGWVSREWLSSSKPNVNTTEDHNSTDDDIIYFTDPFYMYVKPSQGLYLRKGPGTGYGKSGLMAQGTSVYVKGRSSTDKNWFYVYCDKLGSYGWASGTYLSDNYSGNYDYDDDIYDSYYMTVSPSAGLILRDGPGTGYSKIVTMPQGSRVEVFSKSGNWYRVRYGSYYGYANASYLY